MERRAKIVATLGPASVGEEVLRELVRAGVDLIRLNLSHGTHEEHGAALARVRAIALEERVHLPVMVDLMGPRYRLGQVPGKKRSLAAGERVHLGPAEAGADLPVDDPEFLRHVRPGERLLIDGGLVGLTVESVAGDEIVARVVDPGQVATRKGINLPDSDLPFLVSAKDRADVAFAVAHGADYLAASYIGEAAHVEAVREVARAAAKVYGGGRCLPIVAKLERATALEHLEEITAAADGLMVARGDLGVEVPLHTVPIHQKRIVAAGRRAGKPVIVATQMLESMIEQPRPTRAEATDVANAVFDGADALMLSGETAVGHHPAIVVETMSRIIQEAEAYEREQSSDRPSLRPLGGAQVRALEGAEVAAAHGRNGDPAADIGDTEDLTLDVPDVVSAAAVYAASELGVSRIVAFSQTGFTARLVARYRPHAPIVAFTPDERVARQLQLVWGVRPLLAEGEVEHLDGLLRVVDRKLVAAGLTQPGERIIVLMGHPVRERPLTNLMRVHRVRSVAEWERLRPG